MISRRSAKLFFPCVLLVLVAAVATATLGAAPAQSDSQTAVTAQWQFASMKIPADTPNNELGPQILKMGRDGWELVSVVNFSKDGTTTDTAYYFKRPL